MTVGGKFAALESEPLEITDGEQCRYREQGEEYEKDGSLEIFLVQHFRQGKQDKGQQAENRLLAGLCKEGEGEGEERPVPDSVAVKGPAEHQQGKGRKENVQGFYRHGTELEKHRRL